MTLAYVDEDGPQACAVLYATDATPDDAAHAGQLPGGTDAAADAGAGEAPGRGAESAGANRVAGGVVSAEAVASADPGKTADARKTVEAGEVADARETAAEAVVGAVGGPLLYFVTSTSTRHGRALAAPAARVAFTAQRDGQEWSGLTGIQGRGRCRPLSGAERAVGWRAYTRRFPFVEADERLRAALERTTLWELRPDWLRLIDNGQGFGHKEEWRRTEGP
ncbi:pyridoxamine 5'-phosphate oxidase [Streptomyces sp. NPDC021749]|uniref:pyridoxamine 5'-phosphate oxidase n=1 Tax=Streptomyces sp. NPDC021749 TaxID=3154905 RepID=UPI0033C511FE